MSRNLISHWEKVLELFLFPLPVCEKMTATFGINSESKFCLKLWISCLQVVHEKHYIRKSGFDCLSTGYTVFKITSNLKEKETSPSKQ